MNHQHISQWSAQHGSCASIESAYWSMSSLPPVIVNLNSEKEEQHLIDMQTPSDSSFDIPIFLSTLIADIAALEKRISQTTEEAMSVNLEQTLVVLTFHSLIMKIRLEATVKELDSIVDKTFEEEPAPVESEVARMEDDNSLRNRRMFRRGGSQLNQRTVSCDTESSSSTLLIDSNNQLLEKMYKNIEHLMDTLSLRSDSLQSNTSLTEISSASSSSEKTAEQWTNTLRVKLESARSTEEIGRLTTRENIENVMRKMQQYPANMEIQGDCLRVLRTMEVSESACRKIINADCLEHLCEVYTQLKPEQENLIEDVIRIFFVISMYPNLAKFLQKDKYVEILLTATKHPEFKELDIICVDGLCNLLVNASNTKWSLEMTRQDLEERIRRGMSKWILEAFPSYRLTTFAGHLDRINKYTNAIRHFSLWLVAHHTVVGTQEDVKLIRDEGGVPVLVNVLTSEKFDEQLKELAKTALRKLNPMETN